MCVETSFGRSDRVDLHKVVMQGSVPGGMICSNQISKICNKMYKEGNVYMYRGKIPIPALAMVDDIASMTQCKSIEALDANIKTDAFIQRKKLEGQTGAGKCQWIHSGPSKCRNCFSINGQPISRAEFYKYLGDHVSDGWDCLYQKRLEKSQGYSATCQAMSSEVSLGIRVYEIAKLFHQAIFVNGSLVNVETWPNCTEARILKFERIEQMFMRNILKAHSKTPIEALYLELGIVPLRFQLMKRRILYLQDIIDREEDELVKRVVLEQKKQHSDGDFYTQVEDNMKELSIRFEDIMESKEKLKTKVDRSLNEKAYDYLITQAEKHSKVNTDLYLDCNGSEYFRQTEFTPELANLLFKFRTRTFMVKNNFRNNYKNTDIMCPLCGINDDTQEHIMKCYKIIKKYEGTITCKYNDIFSTDTKTLLQVAKTLKVMTQIRINELDSTDTEHM